MDPFRFGTPSLPTPAPCAGLRRKPGEPPTTRFTVVALAALLFVVPTLVFRARYRHRGRGSSGNIIQIDAGLYVYRALPANPGCAGAGHGAAERRTWLHHGAMDARQSARRCGGLRSWLWNYGITFGIQDINEVWGNVSGGIHRGASYDGVTLMSIGLDTQRAFGWEGGTFNVSAWNIRGRNISTDNLLNLQTPSGILATPTTRLWEVWYQQSFLDGQDRREARSAEHRPGVHDQPGSGLFLNTMMGWPMVPSADLYAGGPAYPLSSLGVRLRAQPGNGFTALLGVFQDNPPGGPFDDDGQLRGSTRWGGNFNLRTGALFMAEVQYALNQPGNGEMDYGTAASGLPGTYKLGFWYDTRAFPDQQFDNDWAVARRSCQQRHRTDAAQQFQHLRRDGPDGLASRRGQSAVAQRVRPDHGCAWRPQPDQLQSSMRGSL